MLAESYIKIFVCLSVVAIRGPRTAWCAHRSVRVGTPPSAFKNFQPSAARIRPSETIRLWTKVYRSAVRFRIGPSVRRPSLSGVRLRLRTAVLARDPWYTCNWKVLCWESSYSILIDRKAHFDSSPTSIRTFQQKSLTFRFSKPGELSKLLKVLT